MSPFAYSGSIGAASAPPTRCEVAANLASPRRFVPLRNELSTLMVPRRGARAAIAARALWERVMMRFAAIAACGVALAACASGSDAFKTTVATATLQFESEPAGAEVKLSSGQTCRTPCALAVPATDLTANFTLTGYQPVSVPVKVVPPDEVRPDGEGETAPPTVRFSPSPVTAELTRAAPARRGAPQQRRPTAQQSGSNAQATAPAAPPPSAQSAPPPTSGSPWPPAPPPPAQVR